MKKFLLFFLSLFFGILLFAWIIKIVGVEGLVLALSLFLSWRGIALLFLTFLIVLVGTLRWGDILKKEGLKIPFSGLLQTYLTGFAINYFLPMMVLGGEAIRAHILKEKYSVPWQKGIASAMIDGILNLTSVLLLIFPGIVFFLLEVGLPSKKILFSLLGFLFLLGGAIAFFYFKNSKKESILRVFGINHNLALETEKEILDFFGSKKVFKPLYLSFFRAFLLFLRVWILMFFMGEGIGLSIAWSAFSFAWLGTRIPVPADIGSHDVIQVFAFKALGLGAAKGTALALIIRGLETIISFFGLILIVKFGFQFFEKLFLNKIVLRQKNNEKPQY